MVHNLMYAPTQITPTAYTVLGFVTLLNFRGQYMDICMPNFNQIGHEIWKIRVEIH